MFGNDEQGGVDRPRHRSGEAGRKSLEDRYVHVVHIKDGKLVESWIFDANQDVVDAFWGE